MPKPLIDARQALDDVRLGMHDSELMQKYNLSPKGLESLLKKLVTAGLVTVSELEARMPTFVASVCLAKDLQHCQGAAGQQISARESVTDLKSGMSDFELMKKYRLTAKGLEHLFELLLTARLIDQEDIDRRLEGSESTVDVRGLRKEMAFEFPPPEHAGKPRRSSQAPTSASSPSAAAPGEQPREVPAPERKNNRIGDTEVVTVMEDLPGPPRTPEEIPVRRKRDPLEATLEIDVDPTVATSQEWRCPKCDKPQPHPMDECPVCGIIVDKYMKLKGK